jgi:hypothetical protein
MAVGGLAVRNVGRTAPGRRPSGQVINATRGFAGDLGPPGCTVGIPVTPARVLLTNRPRHAEPGLDL